MKGIADKLAKLSAGLRAMIVSGEADYTASPETPVSNYLVATMRHCNAGALVDAGLWLKRHCDGGGKIFITMAGAASTFEQGITLSEMIRAGKIAAVTVTGANLEESLYRLVAPDCYANIPNYSELTPAQEKELDDNGLRRITNTFLPEEESVRVILDHMMTLWREAQAKGERHHWHWYFFELFERGLVKFEAGSDLDNCWLYWAWKLKVPVFVPGWEDSTMGNIFTQASYTENDAFLGQYKLPEPISMDVVFPAAKYMHECAAWYMATATHEKPHAFLQLGGGIAGDFPICVVPHLKKDYLAELTLAEQEKLIPCWAGFIELHMTPMSAGSYSGAGGKEKITWSKLRADAYYKQVYTDFTIGMPVLAALVLGK